MPQIFPPRIPSAPGRWARVTDTEGEMYSVEVFFVPEVGLCYRKEGGASRAVRGVQPDGYWLCPIPPHSIRQDTHKGEL